MLEGIHFLLTYQCTYECDHCFLYCSPKTTGTFTIKQVEEVLQEGKNLGSVEWIFFEGGEPLLYYPLLLEGVKKAKEMGYQVGIVTNSYPMLSIEDAVLWLKPLAETGIDLLSISNDEFHSSNPDDSPAAVACKAAEKLDIPYYAIAIENPEVQSVCETSGTKGQPITEGGPKYRGRAADKLTHGMLHRKPEELKKCPWEELVEPERVHVDPLGHVHICQGISMGNMWETPLSELVRHYKVDQHPICGPLHTGGPFELARVNDLNMDSGYVDECHFCFLARRNLLNKYPRHLVPHQVYGVEEDL